MIHSDTELIADSFFIIIIMHTTACGLCMECCVGAYCKILWAEIQRVPWLPLICCKLYTILAWGEVIVICNALRLDTVLLDQKQFCSGQKL